MVKFFTLIIVTLLGLIQSSFGITPKNIVGTWEDGSIGSLEFHEDGLFSMVNTPYLIKTLDGNQGKKFSANGSWKLNSNNIIELSIKPNETMKKGFYNELMVTKSKELFSNEVRLSLFLWIDEPGEERYELTKK